MEEEHILTGQELLSQLDDLHNNDTYTRIDTTPLKNIIIDPNKTYIIEEIFWDVSPITSYYYLHSIKEYKN